MMRVLKPGARQTEAVMPGLGPGIHGRRAEWQGVDGRDKPGHDGAERVTI